jgi:regulator of sigma E protease
LHSILSFIVTISLVVVVHEFGHFAVAKFFKVGVQKFSVGFGKVLYKKNIGLTEFSIRLIPLGGFVMFHQKSKLKNINLFEDVNLFKRSLIVLAGPLINFIFAFFLLLFLNQGEQFNIAPKVTAVQPQSIAENVGFKVDDVIVSINSKKINSVNTHNKALIEFANQDLKYLLIRNNEKFSLKINKNNRLDLTRNQSNSNGLYFFPSGINSLVISEVISGSPAEISKIKKNDQVISVNNNMIFNSADFINSIKYKENSEITLKVLRNSQQLIIPVTPRLNDQGVVNKAVIGVKIKPNLLNKDNYISSFKINNLNIISKSFYDVIDGLKMVFRSFLNIITGNIDWRMLSGPISIAEVSSETLSMGVFSYISFLVFLNINVGFLNLLPIPTLDGGQLFFYAIEGILGKPLNKQKMIISQRLGVIILFLVFTLAVYNDVFNFMFN